jgi:hypothetical protein
MSGRYTVMPKLRTAKLLRKKEPPPEAPKVTRYRRIKRV